MKEGPKLIFALLLLLCGCGPGGNRLDVDVSDVRVPEITIHRYDLALFSLDRNNLEAGLEKLKPEYPFFLGTDLSDPSKIGEMRSYLENPRNIDLAALVGRSYQNLDDIRQGLTQAFRHYRFYYPSGTIPRIYSYISGGDYEFPVQFADSVMLIGLDNYLGKDCKVYLSDGVPAYKLQRMTRDHIVPDCIRVLSKVSGIKPMSANTLLDEMINAGKRLYFIDAMIPESEDGLKINYTRAQVEWIRKNESHVWAAIIENRMLFSSDGQTIRVFMADGPFTAEFSKDSPPRLGEWIGWQIVKRYMENQDQITLLQLLSETDAQKILTLSAYKPEKY